MIILFGILGIMLVVLVAFMERQWQKDLQDFLDFRDKAWNELKPSFSAQDVIDAFEQALKLNKDME